MKKRLTKLTTIGGLTASFIAVSLALAPAASAATWHISNSYSTLQSCKNAYARTAEYVGGVKNTTPCARLGKPGNISYHYSYYW